MVEHHDEDSEKYAVFALIFMFICLVSGLFSCIVSSVARQGKKNYSIDALPYFIIPRKYSEESSSNSGILYWWKKVRRIKEKLQKKKSRTVGEIEKFPKILENQKKI